jgi:hypothetical protein
MASATDTTIAAEACAICGSTDLAAKPDPDPGWNENILWRINGLRVCCRCFWIRSQQASKN